MVMLLNLGPEYTGFIRLFFLLPFIFEMFQNKKMGEGGRLAWLLG